MAARRRGPKKNLRLQEQAQNMPAEYLKCRVRGHKWGDDETYENVGKSQRRVWVSCERCGSESYKVWTLRGVQISSGIVYPTDYVMKDTGILSTADRATLRARYIANVLR